LGAMKLRQIVAILTLVGVIFSQPQVLADLDTFSTESATVVLVTNGTYPTSEFTSTRGSDIIGGERDIVLTALQAPRNKVLATGVLSGGWLVTVPSIIGVAQLQYDGIDSSPTLNTTGLGGLDFTKSNANGFLVTVLTDVYCTFTVSVYSDNSSVSYHTVELQSKPVEQNVLLNYGSFKGNANFANVGAVVFEVDLNVAIDFTLSQFAIVAPTEGTLEIDPFTAITDSLILLSSPPYPQMVQTSTSASSILGGERDILLQFNTGSDNRVAVTGVSGNSWSVSFPIGGTGVAMLQYDGVDGSTTLNPVGLGGIDLTQNGGTSFHLLVYTDNQLTVVIRVYSSASAFSSVEVVLIGNVGQQQELFLSFTSFSGNADFSNVGAIELELDTIGNVDILVPLFAISSRN